MYRELGWGSGDRKKQFTHPATPSLVTISEVKTVRQEEPRSSMTVTHELRHGHEAGPAHRGQTGTQADRRRTCRTDGVRARGRRGSCVGKRA